MKLNQKDKIEFRNFLKEELQKIELGLEKIKIPKEILEQLIFDINSETCAKKIAWSGDFLQKLDLSEISFDNVN